MPAEGPAAPVASLDPESRALVELSLVRGLSDEDLAEVLGVSARRVRERREAALARLGVTTRGEREALAAQLRGDREQATAAAPAPVPSGEAGAATAGDVAPAASEPPSRRSRVMLALLGGLSAAAVVALFLAGTDIGDPGPFEGPASDSSGGRTQGEGPGGPALTGEPVALASPTGGEGAGNAALVQREGGARLLLSVRGLATPPEGGYAIWLYNSVSDARLLGGSRRGRFRVEVALPDDADRYSFLDVSRERPDGNRNHGGASVLRTRLAKLLGG